MKLSNLILIGSIAMMALSACAKKPENIAAISVAGEPYRGYSCSRLAKESLALTQNLEVIEAKQRDAAAGDAVGVIMLGMPLSSMTGGDQEAAIGIAKGRLQEVDRLRNNKKCR